MNKKNLLITGICTAATAYFVWNSDLIMSKECQEWNTQLGKIDEMRKNLIEQFSASCKEGFMSPGEKITNNIPAYDPNSEIAKQCTEIMNQSIVTLQNYWKHIGNLPKLCRIVN